MKCEDEETAQPCQVCAAGSLAVPENRPGFVARALPGCAPPGALGEQSGVPAHTWQV